MKSEISELRCAILDPSNFTPPYDQALCAALSDLGIQVSLIGRAVRDDDPFDAAGDMPEPFFYKYSEWARGRLPNAIVLLIKATEHFFNMFFLPRKLVRRNLDVVHFQWTPVPLIDWRVIRKIRKTTPVVLTVHDTAIFHGNASHSAQRLGWNKVLREVDGLIVHVRSVVDPLVELGVERRRIHVIPHPIFSKPPKSVIDSALSRYSIDSLGFCERKVNFLLFGRLAPYKGLDTLLTAIESLPSECKERIRVVLAGRAAFDEAQYRQSILVAGLENIISVNAKFLPEQELIAYLARCDVALFPYHDIDASGALMQALPYAPAIIASKLGVFEELLEHGKTALMVQPYDSNGLADAIAELASDETIVKSLSTEVSSVAGEELSWAAAAKATLSVYRQLAKITS